MRSNSAVFGGLEVVFLVLIATRRDNDGHIPAYGSVDVPEAKGINRIERLAFPKK
jgi:hypothetical protein